MLVALTPLASALSCAVQLRPLLVWGESPLLSTACRCIPMRLPGARSLPSPPAVKQMLLLCTPPDAPALHPLIPAPLAAAACRAALRCVPGGSPDQEPRRHARPHGGARRRRGPAAAVLPAGPPSGAGPTAAAVHVGVSWRRDFPGPPCLAGAEAYA